MNLIEAFNAFDSWTRLNTLSANQRSLYIAIMQLWNAAGRPEYSTIPEQKLTELSGLSKKTFYNNRNQLEELGLIAVVKSKKKSLAPKYKLLDVSVKNDDDFTPEATLEENSSVKNDSNFTPNLTPTVTPEVTPISTPNLAPYTEKSREENRREEKDVVNDNSSFFDNLQKYLGRGLTFPESEQARAWREEQSEQMILKAVSIAVLNRTTSFAYIDKIIRNWNNQGITTLTELQAHEEKREQAKEKQSSTKAGKAIPDWATPYQEPEYSEEEIADVFKD